MSNTGGPAFPCHPGIENPLYDGMTLLDYAAIKAMQGMLSDPIWRSNNDFGLIAHFAYKMAKAMLEARKA
jgi:hypothetical protein